MRIAARFTMPLRILQIYVDKVSLVDAEAPGAFFDHNGKEVRIWETELDSYVEAEQLVVMQLIGVLAESGYQTLCKVNPVTDKGSVHGL